MYCQIVNQHLNIAKLFNNLAKVTIFVPKLGHTDLAFHSNISNNSPQTQLRVPKRERERERLNKMFLTMFSTLVTAPRKKLILVLKQKQVQHQQQPHRVFSAISDNFFFVNFFVYKKRTKVWNRQNVVFSPEDKKRTTLVKLFILVCWQSSVTRLGDIQPFWQNFKCLCAKI